MLNWSFWADVSFWPCVMFQDVLLTHTEQLTQLISVPVKVLYFPQFGGFLAFILAIQQTGKGIFWFVLFFFNFSVFFSTTVFCSGEATKFGRNDSSSPAPPTSLSTAGVQSQPQQAPQAGTQGQGQGQSQGQQTQNQAFLNPPLPPGYGYTGKDKQKCFTMTMPARLISF